MEWFPNLLQVSGTVGEDGNTWWFHVQLTGILHHIAEAEERMRILPLYGANDAETDSSGVKLVGKFTLSVTLICRQKTQKSIQSVKLMVKIKMHTKKDWSVGERKQFCKVYQVNNKMHKQTIDLFI